MYNKIMQKSVNICLYTFPQHCCMKQQFNTMRDWKHKLHRSCMKLQRLTHLD